MAGSSTVQQKSVGRRAPAAAASGGAAHSPASRAAQDAPAAELLDAAAIKALIRAEVGRIAMDADAGPIDERPVMGDVVVCRTLAGAEWPAWVVGVGSGDRLDLVVLHAPRPGEMACATFQRAVSRASDVPANGYPTWRPRRFDEGRKAR